MGYSIMKKIKLYIGVIMITLFFVSCGQTIRTDEPTITVSILPQKYFVEKIAGDQFAVHVMIPEGAPPSNYDPTPLDLQRLSHSDAYFRIGRIGFELANMEKIADLNPELPIYDLSENIEIIGEACHQHDHAHQHSSGDPHIWLSPRNAKQIAQNCFAALSALKPESEALFYDNLTLLNQEIDSLDHALQTKLRPLEGETFFIYHPALTYFARDYNLNQVALEFEGKSPSPVHLQKMIEQAREEQIKVVFIQREFDRSNASVLAKEINGSLIVINPLSSDWIEEISVIGDAFIQ